MARTLKPIRSPRYQGRFAVTLPEVGIPYLAEASLVMEGPHERHAHAEIQVLFVVDGEIGMEIGRNRLRIAAGSGLILLPGKKHRVNLPSPNQTRASASIIDLRLLNEPSFGIVPFLRGITAHTPTPAVRIGMNDAARRLHAAISTGGPARTAHILSAVWELLGHLASEPARAETATGSKTEPGTDRRLAMAERYMADHLSDSIGVHSIADSVNLSRSQLTRLMMHHRGIGPAELLRKLRVDRARGLLETSTLAIKEISRVCGFASPHHFSRVFFEVTGKRPSQRRRVS